LRDRIRVAQLHDKREQAIWLQGNLAATAQSSNDLTDADLVVMPIEVLNEFSEHGSLVWCEA
jgi:hypothetical protein